MAAPVKKFNITFVYDKYKKKDGSDGLKYGTAGEAVEWENGNITMNFHSLPLPGKWDGTFTLFPKKENNNSNSGGGATDNEDLPF